PPTKISLWLYKLIDEAKNVDTRLSTLSKEVSLLTGLLTSVERTVRECQSRSLTLAHMHEHLWQQIDNTLVDCKITLEGLDALAVKIRGESGWSRNIGKLLKKSSMHLKLTAHGDELSLFKDKIYNSNCAMQTATSMLSV